MNNKKMGALALFAALVGIAGTARAYCPPTKPASLQQQCLDREERDRQREQEARERERERQREQEARERERQREQQREQEAARERERQREQEAARERERQREQEAARERDRQQQHQKNAAQERQREQQEAQRRQQQEAQQRQQQEAQERQRRQQEERAHAAAERQAARQQVVPGTTGSIAPRPTPNTTQSVSSAPPVPTTTQPPAPVTLPLPQAQPQHGTPVATQPARPSQAQLLQQQRHDQPTGTQPPPTSTPSILPRHANQIAPVTQTTQTVQPARVSAPQTQSQSQLLQQQRTAQTIPITPTSASTSSTTPSAQPGSRTLPVGGVATTASTPAAGLLASSDPTSGKSTNDDGKGKKPAKEKKVEWGDVQKEAVAICHQQKKGTWKCYGPLDNDVLGGDETLEKALARQTCPGGTWAAGGPNLRGEQFEAYRCNHALGAGDYDLVKRYKMITVQRDYICPKYQLGDGRCTTLYDGQDKR